MNHAKTYRYRAATYDGTNENDLTALAMDIVYYESAHEPLSEWAEFDTWIDGRYKPSDVYSLLTNECGDKEIAREFASYMAVEYRDHVIEQGLLEGIVEVVE